MQKLRLTLVLMLFSLLAQAQERTFEGLSQPTPPNTILNEKFKALQIFQIDATSLNSYLQSQPEQIHFALELKEAFNWNLLLTPNDFRTSDYQSTYQNADGTHIAPRRTNKAFNGYVQGTGGGTTALTVDDNFIYGFVQQNGEQFFIEPLRYFIPEADEDLFIVYAQSNVIQNTEHKCGADELEHNKRIMAERQQQASKDKDDESRSMLACFDLELAIAADYAMFVKYGSVAGVENHTIGVMNNVQTNYDNEFTHEINFVIVTHWISACNTCDPWTTSTDAGDLLSSFRNWGNGGGFGLPFDNGQLWTNRNFDGGTVGIAYLNGLCNSVKYHCIQDYTNTAWALRVVTAHEIGHNLSSGHDAPNSGFIMAPSVNNSNTWSTQSQNSINSYVQTKINSGCLSACSAGVPPVANFTSDVQYGCVPYTVNFTDNSTGATSWFWTFENGNPSTSTLQNPSVTYNTEGVWDVTLEVTNSAGNNTLVEVDYITADDVPVVGFTVFTVDLQAIFTNTSTNATSYYWDFGDGIGSSTEVSPTYTYDQDGEYIVTLEATNSCGFTTTTEFIVIVTPPIAFFTSDIVSGCVPLTVQFYNQSSSNTTSWNWSFSGGSPAGSSDPDPLVVYNNPGLFDVSLTVSNAAGFDTYTLTQNIEVVPFPTVDFSFVITNDTVVQFTNNSTDADSYLWDFGDGNTSTEINPTHTYTASGSYNVILVATNPCDAPSIVIAVDIVMAVPPVAGFQASSTNGCADLVVDFTDQSTNADSWNWSFPGGSPSSSTDQNPMVTYTTSGTYDVTLIVTNNLGMDTLTQTSYINVNDIPTADFQTTTNGTVVDFTNNTIDGVTYAWGFGDGNTSNAVNPTNDYLMDGVYTVELISTNACGDDTTSQTVTIVTPPTAAFSADIISGCADLTVNFTDQSSANATAWNWTFAGGTPSSSTLQNPTVTYNTAGTYDVVLTVSNSAGNNTITQSAYVTVDDVPGSGFTTSLTDFTVTFNNTTTNGTTYAWEFGDGNTSTDANPSNTYPGDGTYTVQLIATNSCGNDTTTQNVIISTIPVAGFTANNTNGCVDLTVNFTDQSSLNTTSWAWVFTGGNPATSTQQNPTVVYSTPGTYDVELTVSNGAGANTVTQTGYITVGDVPNAGFSSSTNGTIANFTNSSADANTYAWNFGDGNTSSATDPSNDYGMDGTYIVELIATNACGNDTTTQTVVISTPPVAGFASNATSGCADLTINFNDQSSSNTTSWDWTFAGGSPATSTQQNPTVTYSTSGSYDVILTVSNAAGVTNTITQTAYITVTDVPVSGFSSSTNGTVANFTNNTTNGTTYAWDFGDGNTSSSTDPSNDYGVDGTYTVELIATNACGNDTTTQTVVISTPPVAGFASNTTSGCADLTVNFNDQSSSNATSWDWTFAGGSPATSTQQNPTVTYSASGIYDVILTVSNAAGVTNTITQTAYITVTDVPGAGFSNSVSGMVANFTNSSTNATSYAWDFGDGNNSTATDPSNTYAADGTYTVQLIATNSCGNDTTTQTVVISNAPVAAFGSNVTSGCADLTVNFSDQSSPNTTSWDWTFTGGTPSNSTQQNPTVVYDVAGTYTVTLTVSNAGGLQNTITQTAYISVSDIPASGFSNSITGLTANFTNNSTNATSYAWDFGDGNNSTATDPSNTYAADGSYVVQLIATNACGNDTTTQTVVIATPPTAGFTANVTSGCGPLSVAFTDQSSSNTTSWSWTFAGGTPSTSSNASPTVVYDTPGTYSVTLEVTNGVGNDVFTETNYIVVAAGPSADFNPTVTGTVVDFNNNSDNATSYAWDFGDGNTSSATNPSNNYSGDGVYTVQLIATGDCGTDTTTQTVTIVTPPVADFVANTLQGCTPLTVDFTDMSTANATAWNWTMSGATPATSNAQNPSVVYNTPGTYTVILEVSNSAGTNTITKTNYIVVNTAPTAGFGSTVAGTTANFTNSSSNATTYSWDFGDGNGSADTNPSHTYIADGMYTVVLTASNNCGDVTFTEIIEISTNPVAGFSADFTVGCGPLTVNFTDQSSPNTTTWDWTFEGANPGNSTEQNPSVTFDTPGSYTVTLVAGSASGTNTFSQTAYITVLTTPNAGFTSSTAGTTTTFSNTTTGGDTYLWDFGDNNTSTDPNPQHTYSTDGTYTVTMTATNDCGSETITQTVVIVTPPTAGFSANVTTGCAPMEVTFIDQSSDNTTEWLWNFDGGNPTTSSDQNPVVIFTTPGVYSVTLEVTNAAGSNTFSQASYIIVDEAPTASFTSTQAGSTVDFNNTSTNATTYSWDFGDGGSSSQINPSYSYTAAGTFTVTLTAINDCGSVTFTEVVVIESAPSVAFTADVTEGCAPLEVSFTDQSQGNIISWDWTFEGVTPSFSNEQNPVVVYETPGVYSVTLEATTAGGSESFTQTGYIIVLDGPSADFTISGSDPDYTFTNTSTLGDTYLWDFGDSNTSTEENPTHSYTMSGTYTVSLTTTNTCGSVTTTQQITVTVEVPPVAAFTVDINEGCAPLTVNYFDQSSSNTSSWFWTFEGGTPATSTDQNPQVTYTTPGIYNVTLTASNAAGENTATQTDFITVTEVAPLSAFNSTVTGSAVIFENTSSGASTFDWDFGDGNSSSLEDPTHTYLNDGTYIVTLTVTNSCGVSVVTETIVIATLPVAGFSMDVNSGCAPLDVNFTDASSNNTVSWAWTFPGGTPSSSTDQNPIVSYSTSGAYDVTLVATNAQGTDTEVQMSIIVVDVAPTADFTYSGSGVTIDFTNNSTAGTSYDWNFGDGNSSTDADATHTYLTGGDFDVQLIVTNSCGMDTIIQTVTVAGSAPVASFSGSPITGCSPLTVNFTDESIGADTWVWGFESGTPATSSEQNPVIVYSTPGTYPVSLSVTNAFGSNSITQVGYIVVETVPVADFSFAVNDAVANFTNNSTGGGTLLWDFGDGETSTFEDPQHEYTQSGGYTVTLTVTNSCGTSTWTEDLEIIIISTELPENIDAFNLYPNPNNGSFYLEIEANPTEELQVQLYDIIGRRLMNRSFDFSSGSLQKRFDMNHLAAGTYIVQLNVGDNILTRKLIVE